MLDVHPPHEPVHGWRDFLLHIATITIGLLIAIGLEQTVEWMHHRHLVREARENIHVEMEANQKLATQNVAAMQRGAEGMRGNVAAARALRDRANKPDAHTAFTFNLEWSGFSDAAWRSARDTGALAYMPTAEVQRDADLYAQQQIVDRKAVEVYTRQAEASAPLMLESDPVQLPAEDLHRIMLDCAVLFTDLTTLKQLSAELEHQYQTILSGS